MNYYCIYIRKRKNKPYCKLKKEEILLYECKNCFYKEYKNNYPHKSGKIKNKSNKLAKLERKRFSVFTDDMNKCFLCNNPKDDIHELFRGRNRKNSMKYGMVLPLCRLCHSTVAEAVEFEDFWHKKGQLYFEEHFGSREEFIKVFRRNYLD